MKKIKNKTLIMQTLVVVLLFTGCIDGCEFTQQLNANEQNIVIFTECHLANLGDNKVETVFASILGDDDVWIFTEDATEGWISYYNGRTHNELTDIEANKNYNVYVDIECILTLG